MEKKILRNIARAAGSTAVLLAGAANAADSFNHQRMGSPEPVIDSVIYWGSDLSYGNSGRYGLGVDAGFVTALNGDLGIEGWTLTGNLGLSRSVDLASRTNAAYGSVLLGYLWPMDGYYFSLGAGVNVINNNQTPPGGPTDGSKIGALIQYGFETTQTNAFYTQSYGSYSTANDEIYFHAKAGYKNATLRFGPEFTLSDDNGGQPTLRFGGVVGDIPLGDKVKMSISAGYQRDLNPGVADRFYTMVGFSVPLSTR